MARLTQTFYARGAREVAQALLGKRLVRRLDGRLLSGRIVETEAYCDAAEPDLERIKEAWRQFKADLSNPVTAMIIVLGVITALVFAAIPWLVEPWELPW